MNKKLPSIFANKINRNLNNNVNCSVSNETKKSIFEKNDIERKINEIFNSTNYLYRVLVIIKLKSGYIERKIIGKNKNQLITIDNELIPIDDIIDIKLKEQ